MLHATQNHYALASNGKFEEGNATAEDFGGTLDLVVRGLGYFIGFDEAFLVHPTSDGLVGISPPDVTVFGKVESATFSVRRRLSSNDLADESCIEKGTVFDVTEDPRLKSLVSLWQ